MSLFERVKTVCEERNIPFRQVELEIGFGNGTIKKWETQKPSYDKVIKIANYLNVSLTWLLIGKEDEELNEDEHRLIEYYRQADSRGKRRILQTAEMESQELESSTSKIG